ncbi:MAG: protein kinase [Planctomycetes bacterium]|nr:protein kinase [Planctomycetota bacterium]
MGTLTQAGDQFGEFVLLGEIGRGGMGVVHRAAHTPSGRCVALKMLPSLVGLTPESVARFHREAEAAARVSHPGVVPIHGFGEQDGVHWIAMGYVDGVALDALIDSLVDREPGALRGTFAEETALAEVLGSPRDPRVADGPDRYARSCARIIADAADALAAAHRVGVVHRDVKPGNLLLDPAGRVVVVDFGLAWDEAGARLTGSGDVVGTPAYMAPEQALGGDQTIDARTDVYGLGATLFEMLTLRPPFDGAHAAEILRRIVTESPPRVRSLAPAVPEPLARLCDACLAKDPSDRPPDMVALRDGLGALAAGAELPKRVIPRDLGRASRRALRRMRSALIGLGVALSVGLAAGLAATAVRDQRDERAGREALELARAQIAAGRFLEAESSFARAGALLGDEMVRQARSACADALFERLYARGLFGQLAGWLESWDASSRDPAWAERLRRARGVGELVVDVRSGRPLAACRVRRLGDPAATWQSVASRTSLEIGDWLVEATPRDCATLRRIARIERDGRTGWMLGAVQLDGAPEHAALVDAPPGPVWLAVGEERRDDWARLLGGLDDPDLRAELEPLGWRTADVVRAADLPVVGLSPALARTYAALRGGHVPDPATHAAAADPGGLGWRFPWGDAFRPGWVAAGGVPVAVDTGVAGASPLGVRDLCGNAGDLVVADGSAWLAGGSFAAEQPESLLAAARVLLPWSERRADLGLRLAWFAPPAAADPAAVRTSADACAAARRADAAVLVWRVSPRGGICLALDAAPGELALGERLSTAAAPRVRAGEGAVGVVARCDGATVLRLPAAPPGARVRCELDFEPIALARARAGEVELRLPAVLGGEGAVQLLHVPPAVRLLSAWPEPCAVEHGPEGLVLTFRQPAWVPASAAEADGPRVALLIDGHWAERWPARATLERLVQESAPQLGGAPTVVDVGAVGALLVAELEVERAFVDPEGRPAPGVREGLVAWFDGRSPRPELLAVEPIDCVDGGRATGAGYAHETLGVDLALAPATGDQLARLGWLATDLQVRVANATVGPDVDVIVTGLTEVAVADRWAALFELSAGAFAAPGARLGSDPAELPFGAVGAGRTALCSEWLFAGDDGAVSRERWAFLSAPPRAVLVRFRVTGSDATAVRDRAAQPAVRALFARVEAGLTLRP